MLKCRLEESKHFNLVCDCLEAIGSYYGALPAHAGMWRAAEDTKDDLLGRLAVVPMVLEARGLDVTPGMIDIFAKANATQAVDALNVIYSEEVAHVAYGSKWFNFMCGRDNLDPKDVFHTLVRKYFKGALKAPFNEEKRADAGAIIRAASKKMIASTQNGRYQIGIWEKGLGSFHETWTAPTH